MAKTTKKTTKKSTIKEKKIKLDEYVEDEEIEEVEEFEDFEDEDDFQEEQPKKQKNKRKKVTQQKKSTKTEGLNIKLIINIVFIVIMVILAMITVDVIAVARYDVGPFFAIQTKTYKDGGTKEFLGFGYKVIKYNQIEGRKGKTIGLWSMPYSVESTEISILDLALEFEKDYNKTSNKFYNQYLKVTGTIREIDTEKHQIIMEYNDVDGKYTLELIGHLTEEVIITTFEAGEEIELYGTPRVFKAKKDTKPNTIELEGCFVKKIEK